MGKYGKYHPSKLISDGYDDIFVGVTFLAFLEEVPSKYVVVTYHPYYHSSCDSPNVLIPHLGYLALFNIFDESMDSRSKPWVRDGLCVVIETPYISNFSQGIEDPLITVVCCPKNLRECDGEELFPLSCPILKVQRNGGGFQNGEMRHPQEACCKKGILFAGLGLPKEKFHDVIDEEGINDHSIIAYFSKKDGQVDMIIGSGSPSDKKSFYQSTILTY